MTELSRILQEKTDKRPIMEAAPIAKQRFNSVSLADLQQFTEQDKIKNPSKSETLGAAFRKQNTLVSAYEAFRGLSDFQDDPNFNIAQRIEGTKYNFDDLKEIKSEDEFLYRTRKIDQETRDNQILENAGTFSSITSQIGAGIFDPINLIPIGGAAYKAYKGGKVAKGIVRGAEIGLASEVATESILQATQETRSTEETIINIGAGTAFGGLIGGFAAKLSKGDFERLAEGTRKEGQGESPKIDIDEEGNLLQSAGAAQVRPKTLADEALDKPTEIAVKATNKINPTLRILKGQSVKAKELVQDLVINNLFFKKNEKLDIEIEELIDPYDPSKGTKKSIVTEKNIASPQSAEVATKIYDGGLAKSLDDHQKIFRENAKGVGGKLFKKGWEDYNHEISLAMIRGGKSDVAGVEKAASVYKAHFDNMGNEAVRAGLLKPEQIRKNYLTRIYLKDEIIVNKERFKEIVQKNIKIKLLPSLRGELLESQKKLKGMKEQKKEYYDLREQIRINEEAIQSDELYDEISESIYNKIVGNEFHPSHDLTVDIKGSAKPRTLDFIPDEELRPFLEKDITKIARHYTRSMGADIEMKRKFNNLTLEPQIKEITDEYSKLQEKAKPKEKLKLGDEKDQAIKIIKTYRDLLRGHHVSSQDPDGIITKGLQAMRMLQYTSKLGGVLLSSLADTGQHVLKHGLFRVLGKGVPTLLTNLKAIKLSVKDAKLGGLVTETILSNRMMAYSDMFNINRAGGESIFQKTLEGFSDKFSKLNLLNHWNDYQKGFASVLTQERIITNLKSGKDKRYMARLGIGKHESNIINKQLSKHSYEVKGFPIANLEKWDDLEAKRIYQNALNFDVDEAIVTKHIGDIPIWANSELGKTVLQFKSFLFSAFQKTFLRSIGQRDMATINGIIAMVGMGMMVSYVKAIESGRDTPEDALSWILEGIDRSGIMGILTEVNGLFDTVGVGVGRVFGAEPLSRYQSRNAVGSLLGVSAGSISDIVKVLHSLSADGELTEGDERAIRRNIPFQNLFYVRKLFDNFLD